jgi:hypothetical protein
MTQRMFVCHAKSDIEATSEIVDALEGALELQTGTLVASSLPGYAADVRGEGDLHATLTGATLMLALFTERSTYDPEFVFELGAAWALGIDVLPLLLGATSETDVPWPLRDRPSIRAQDPTAWNELVTQLSHRLQVGVRDRAIAAPLRPPVAAEVPVVEQAAPVLAEPEPEADPEPVTETERELPMPEMPPALDKPFQAQLDAVEALHAAYELADTKSDETDPGTDPDSDDDDPYAGRSENPVSIIAPRAVGSTPIEIPRMAPIPAEAFEPDSEVRPHLPSYRMALEAGRALSDCVFNRGEGFDFTKELEEPFGRFVDAMGGSWSELRKLQDFDVWLGVTENLLQNLPDDGRRIGAWYEVGYELAILHNLAGQGLFDTEERRAEAERLWRKALERFLIRAENASIPYEDLARVLALLENLVATRDERDLSNIGRSLDELRRQAAGADRQHTAA